MTDAPGPVEIRDARLPDEVPLVRALFREYVDGLGVDLSFQDVEAELAGLPGAYAPPAGRLLLAWSAGAPVGCVALRPLGDGAGEMKRLYLRPAGRGLGLGRALAERVRDAARDAGYARLRLDTLATMHDAQRLYRAMGFVEIAPYAHNPIAGTRFLELDLRTAAPDARRGGLRPPPRSDVS